MDAPADWPSDWIHLPAAAVVVPLARLDRSGLAPTAVVHFRAWRFAGCGRLVDGRFRSRRSHRGFAIPARDAPCACLRDLCCDHLDRPAAGRAPCNAGAAADTPERDGAAAPRAIANLPRCIG